jgi:smad nuclear-interacting protein 1
MEKREWPRRPKRPLEESSIKRGDYDEYDTKKHGLPRRTWSDLDTGDDEEIIEKEKPNFGKSGLLEKEQKTNRKGIILKYQPPKDARIPLAETGKWRLFEFEIATMNKSEDANTGKSHRLLGQSCFLFGRDKAVVDVVVDHDSASKQHAVIQFRVKPEKKDNSSLIASGAKKQPNVRPYLMDLESTNGTFINKNRISNNRFYELLNNDVINFGNSKTDFVLIKEEED